MSDVDVRTWAESHSLARHGREGLALGTGLTVLGLSYALGLRPWGLVSAAVLVIIWRTVTGWQPRRVTVDPVRRAIEWRRHWGRGETCLAGFDELVGAVPIDSWFSDAVRLNLGARMLVVRVPKGEGPRFAESLQAAAKDVRSDGENRA